MKFLEKSNESDFWTSLEGGLKKNASFENNLKQEQVDKALNHLMTAAEAFNAVGLKKEAQMALVIKEVCDEPSKGLTSEKMIKNLEEKGWVFNADDSNFEDEDDEEIEVEEPPMD